MSNIERCPRCGATSPVVQSGHCGGCVADIRAPGGACANCLTIHAKGTYCPTQSGEPPNIELGSGCVWFDLHRPCMTKGCKVCGKSGEPPMGVPAMMEAIDNELGRQAHESVDMPYVGEVYAGQIVLDGSFDLRAIARAAIAAIQAAEPPMDVEKLVKAARRAFDGMSVLEEARFRCEIAAMHAARPSPDQAVVEKLERAMKLIGDECERADGYRSAKGLARNIMLIVKPATEAARKQG